MNRLAWSLSLSLLLAANLPGQNNFVYTNDDVNGPNTVSGFSVAANGTLTLLAGSPFLTGGTGQGGGFFAANRATVTIVNNLLFAENEGTADVSVFTVNPTSGNLTLVPGSPFPVGGASQTDISLAVTPDGAFLFAANSGSATITVSSIAANGSLSMVGSPTSLPSTPDGIKVTPDGKFLAVALLIPNQVAMFSIGAGGSLTPVPGSPFSGTGSPGSFGGEAGLDANCASNELFGGEATGNTTIVDAYTINADGSLTPVSGSPFTPGVGVNSNVPLLSPNDETLFVSNQGSSSITVFTVNADGTLTLVPGSPFPTPANSDPSGMATNQAGTFLYVAEGAPTLPGQVDVFSIGPGGALTPVPGTPFATGQKNAGTESLTAYPPKQCSRTITVPANPAGAVATANYGPYVYAFQYPPLPPGSPIAAFSVTANSITQSQLSVRVAGTPFANAKVIPYQGGGANAGVTFGIECLDSTGAVISCVVGPDYTYSFKTSYDSTLPLPQNPGFLKGPIGQPYVENDITNFYPTRIDPTGAGRTKGGFSDFELVDLPPTTPEDVFQGFQPPMAGKNGRSFTARTTIPIKFQVKDPNGNLVTSPPHTLPRISVEFNGTAQGTTGANFKSVSPNNFQFDSKKSTYQYFLSTTGYASGSYTIIVSADFFPLQQITFTIQ